MFVEVIWFQYHQEAVYYLELRIYFQSLVARKAQQTPADLFKETK